MRWVELLYADLHGIPRGKTIPSDMFEQACIDGCALSVTGASLGFVSNPLGEGTPLDSAGGDFLTRLVPDTLVQTPWDPDYAWCLLEDVDSGPSLSTISPRHLLKKVQERIQSELGLRPIIGAEQEFYLARVTDDEEITPYASFSSPLYMTGRQVDPHGVVHDMAEAAQYMGLHLTAWTHEFGRGQYEMSLRQVTALDAADRVFLLRKLIKEGAVRSGLHATFIGKPFHADASSGFHVHLSLQRGDGTNAFSSSAGDILAPQARQFAAGILRHVAALTPLLVPTVNGYRRLRPESFVVPTRRDWGYNDRRACIRVPPTTGESARLEVRLADGAANPYLVVAALLLAGLDGLRNSLPLPDRTESESIGTSSDAEKLPGTLGMGLSALVKDEDLCEAIGSPLINVFCAQKTREVEFFEDQREDDEERGLALERRFYWLHL